MFHIFGMFHVKHLFVLREAHVTGFAWVRAEIHASVRTATRASTRASISASVHSSTRPSIRHSTCASVRTLIRFSAPPRRRGGLIPLGGQHL